MDIIDKEIKVKVDLNGVESWKDVLTVEQLSSKTGRSGTQIRNMLNQIDRQNGGTRLTSVYPFPNSKLKEDRGTGPRFVLVDTKCEKFIQYCKKNPIN